jgi:hypothetical protein
LAAAGSGVGTAEVTASFDGWKDGGVKPATYAVQVVGAKEQK